MVAALYPLAWLARQVGGPDAGVTDLTPPGAEPHDLELAPRQIVEVGRADLVVYAAGVQPALDAAVAEHAAGRALDAAGVPAPAPAASPPPAGDDPHVWLDPVRFAAVARALGERLAAADADHAAGYRTRAAALAGRLAGLDAELRAGLEDCRRRTIVTAHASFGHLAQRYGLRQIAISGIDPQAEPSPARIAELVRIVRAEGVTTIFTETLVSPRTAQTLAREAGVRTAVLDPIEGLAPGAPADYTSIMRSNLAALRTSLECR